MRPHYDHLYKHRLRVLQSAGLGRSIWRIRQRGSVKEVVEAGLCIGCGLCEALAPERWKVAHTPQGRLRPSRIVAGSDAEILQACTGAVARPNGETAPLWDAVWGLLPDAGGLG